MRSELDAEAYELVPSAECGSIWMEGVEYSKSQSIGPFKVPAELAVQLQSVGLKKVPCHFIQIEFVTEAATGVQRHAHASFLVHNSCSNNIESFQSSRFKRCLLLAYCSTRCCSFSMYTIVRLTGAAGRTRTLPGALQQGRLYRQGRSRHTESEYHHQRSVVSGSMYPGMRNAL